MQATELLQRVLDELDLLGDDGNPPRPSIEWTRGVHAARLSVEALADDLGLIVAL